MQRLSEGTDITLTIRDHTASVDLRRLRQPATDGIGCVRDDHAWIPDLVKRVVSNSTTGVSQTRVFPSQNNGDVGGEALLCAVDAIDVDKPYLDGDLSWARASGRPLGHGWRFRAVRPLNPTGEK